MYPWRKVYIKIVLVSILKKFVVNETKILVEILNQNYNTSMARARK